MFNKKQAELDKEVDDFVKSLIIRNYSLTRVLTFYRNENTNLAEHNEILKRIEEKEMKGQFTFSKSGLITQALHEFLKIANESINHNEEFVKHVEYTLKKK